MGDHASGRASDPTAGRTGGDGRPRARHRARREPAHRDRPQGLRPRGHPRRLVPRAGGAHGGDRRRVGLGQVDHRAGHPRHPAGRGAHHLGPHPVAREGGRHGARPGAAEGRFLHPPEASRRQDVDHLPGADDLALAAAHDRQPGGRGPDAAPRRLREGRQGHRHRHAAPGRLPRSDRRLFDVPDGAVGRVAPARGHRHGADLPPGAGHRRRADDGARRLHAGQDPGPAAPVAGQARHGRADDHARPGRRRQHGRRGGGDVSRPGHGGRAGRGHLPRPAARIPQGPARRGAGPVDGLRREAARAARHRRRRARRHEGRCRAAHGRVAHHRREAPAAHRRGPDAQLRHQEAAASSSPARSASCARSTT